MVLQMERYSTFKFDSQVTIALDLQCFIIKYATGLVIDENEFRLSVQERRQQQWEACITKTSGNDYYKLYLTTMAAKFWNVFGLQEGIDPDDIQGKHWRVL